MGDAALLARRCGTSRSASSSHTGGLARNQLVKLRDVRPGHEYEDLFGRMELVLGEPDRFEYSSTFEPRDLDAYVQRPVGGLHASIDDLARFAAEFMAGARNVLQPATFEQMVAKRVRTGDGDAYYGFGVYRASTARGDVWTHTGAGQGTMAFYSCVPRERFAVVAATNAAGYQGWRDVRRCAERELLGTPLF